MNDITTMFDEKLLKLLETLTPERREKLVADLTCDMRSALVDALAIYMCCDDCPIAVYCGKHRDRCCESIIYDYLEEDFDDETKG